MTIHIDAFTSFIIIGILGMIFILFGITTFVLISKFKRINRQLEDTNRLLYFNLKDGLTTRTQTQECLSEITDIREDVNELSVGLQIKLKQDAAKANMKRYPKPDEVLQITETIKDFMSIEASKRSQQKSPIGGALVDITELVIKTYPHIIEDYIMNKCIAIIQDFVY